MQFKKTLSCTLLAALALATAVDARSLRDDGVPAEVPPASFKANQYIDSRGCVFIRAGVDGAVSWVPRVTRDRKLVCGMQPSNVGGTTTVAAVEEPEVIEIAPPVAAAPKPVAVAAKPKPAPVRIAKPRVAPARPVMVHKPTVTSAAPQVAAVTGPAGCSHLSAQSRKYLSHPTAQVRCGSQNNAVSTVLSAPSAGYKMPSYQNQSGQMVVATGVYPGQTVKHGALMGNTPVVPKHLYHSHQEALNAPKPPEGYRTVWKDDRLNPNRAVQTTNGQQSMAGVWNADKIPMVAHKPGSSITKSRVSTSGGYGNKTMVITPNTYVQVAAYHSSSDAQKVARRVRGMGLPVRIGKISQGYQEVRMVLAGPFYSHAEAQSALSMARSAGFSNAHIK